jgi:hypothetical protein
MLTLEHIAHKDGIGEEHLKQFGPGAVGIGWDLALHGLARHEVDPTASAPAMRARLPRVFKVVIMTTWQGMSSAREN